MRAHVIKDGIVVNTIVVDSLDDTPPIDADEIVEATTGGIGWRYKNGTFEDPTPSQSKNSILAKLHESVGLTRSKFKMALLDMGELDNVKSYMNSDSVDERVRILWEDSLYFKRNDPALLKLAKDLGYSDELLDQLFNVQSS